MPFETVIQKTSWENSAFFASLKCWKIHYFSKLLSRKTGKYLAIGFLNLFGSCNPGWGPLLILIRLTLSWWLVYRGIRCFRLSWWGEPEPPCSSPSSRPPSRRRMHWRRWLKSPILSSHHLSQHHLALVVVAFAVLVSSLFSCCGRCWKGCCWRWSSD